MHIYVGFPHLYWHPGKENLWSNVSCKKQTTHIVNVCTDQAQSTDLNVKSPTTKQVESGGGGGDRGVWTSHCT